MGKIELYIIIAVFLLITVALIWCCAKVLLDMQKRRNEKRKRNRERR